MMGKIAKHNFKIGDRVKLKYAHDWENIGDIIGVIIRFTAPYIRVDWGGEQKWKRDYPHLPKEIEHTIKVGEQLLFSFMKGG